MLSKNALDFLKELSKNNNRDWFHANKKRYESDLKQPFESFIGQLIESFGKIDPEINIQPKEAIFRIYRDTRFSKDKTPYKTHVGAIISKFGRKGKEHPGFYIHIEPGQLMMGGGAYFLPTESLKKVRHFIMHNSGRFNDLISDAAFVEKFGELKGDKNKRIPKEFRDFHEEQALIANKQFYYMAELPAKSVLKKDVVEFVTDYFKTGQAFNEFLVEALSFD